MPKIRDNDKYDHNDEKSIVNYAKKLEGITIGELILDPGYEISKGKGDFGRMVETEIFFIDNNSESVPDFEDVGIELKSTPIKRTMDGRMVSKERLVLSIINYMTLLKDGWDVSFYNKNGRLLIIFYLHEKDVTIYDHPILKTTLWEYPEEDLWIIKNDWNKIAAKVREGRAHELSERDTMYLAAARKGAGHGKDNRPQPYSDTMAPQRAFSLKQSYVNQIWSATKDSESVIKNVPVAARSFEDEVISRFSAFKRMHTDRIRGIVDPTLNKDSKSYYETLARRMMGVRTKKISEFEKAGIKMKTMRLKENGVPKEDMSFPMFLYPELVTGNWEDSDLYDQLDHRFLFIVYQIDKEDVYFKGAAFWSVPDEDMEEARRVWSETVSRVKERKYDDLPKKSEGRMIHVRPHGRNSSDTTPGLDGEPRGKKCFWINGGYISNQLKNSKFFQDGND